MLRGGSPIYAGRVKTLTGGCDCGAVGYAVADEFEYASNCHCSRCRASTGSAFKSFAGIPREKLTLTAGADRLMGVGGAPANHTPRGACGPALVFGVPHGACVHLAEGALHG